MKKTVLTHFAATVAAGVVAALVVDHIRRARDAKSTS